MFPKSILKAVDKWNINLKKSFFIGDQITDLEAAKRAGLRFYYKDKDFFDKQIKKIIGR